MFQGCEATKVSTVHLFELRWHVKTWLWVSSVLRGDCDFIFHLFSQFCCITLNTDVFPDLLPSVNCWLIMNGSYESMRVIRGYFFFMLCFAMGGGGKNFFSGEAGYTLLNLAGSTLSGFPLRTDEGKYMRQPLRTWEVWWHTLPPCAWVGASQLRKTWLRGHGTVATAENR